MIERQLSCLYWSAGRAAGEM